MALSNFDGDFHQSPCPGVGDVAHAALHDPSVPNLTLDASDERHRPNSLKGFLGHH